MQSKSAWEIGKTVGRIGTGNWDAWNLPIEVIWQAAEKWKKAVGDLDKGWLCWNVNDDWCTLQQKLVQSIGWTPIVGWDPNCGVKRPPLVSGAIAIDFNADLNLPAMLFHFPLEFVFLWIKKLAFWHSDLLLRPEKMVFYGQLFDKLNNGECAAVYDYGGLRNILKINNHRYWELLGCTTEGASRSQFENGCGWWRHISMHPNCPNEFKEKKRREKLSYEHGVGILYWKRRYGGKVHNIKLKHVSEGHFTGIGKEDYRSTPSKNEELTPQFKMAVKKLGLHDFL